MANAAPAETLLSTLQRRPTPSTIEGTAAIDRPRTRLRDYEWVPAWSFIFVHVLTVGALFTGVTRPAIVWAVVLYVVRMFGVTAGYHRYFAHRTFKTSRPLQFLLALLAQSSSQKGVLWWAAHHRAHHKYSDTELDVHSPIRRGFLYAHVGWIYDHTSETDLSRIRDFGRFPELRWLNTYWFVPPVALGLVLWLLLGLPGLTIAFAASTIVLWHCTFFINSLTHVWGSKRFVTSDESRNNLWLAIVTLGEGWHNNHHYYQSCARQGFRWWEFDPTYYVLRAMAAVGLIWDLREPPAHLLRAAGSAAR